MAMAGSSRQVSLAELNGDSRTAAFVKEFPSAAEFMRQLKMGQKYYFVRMRDGSMRAIEHTDAANAGRILLGPESRGSVGYTSLVELGTALVNAGEIHVGPTGVIQDIICESGHFRVPLGALGSQRGRVFPRSVLTLAKSTPFTALLDQLAVPNFTHIAVYTSALVAVLTIGGSDRATHMSSCFILAYHESTCVKIVVLAGVDDIGAREAYNAVSLNFAKVLIHKPSNTELLRYGMTEYVDMCIKQVRQINTVFPIKGASDHANLMPLSSSCFILAYHESTSVKIVVLVGLDDISAREAYNAVAPTFAKVLIHKPSNTELIRHGMTEYVDKCIKQVRQINTVFPINVASARVNLMPLSLSCFILAYHESTCVKIVVLAGVDDIGAREAYDAVSLNFAKVLIHKPSNTELVRYGMTEYVDKCIEQVRQINTVFPIKGASDHANLMPLSSSCFILAYRESTSVKIVVLAGVDDIGAREAYNAVSLNFAKVLIHKPSNTELVRYGMTEYVDMCIEQVRQINTVFPINGASDHANLMPWSSSCFVLAFHEYTCVRIVALAGLDDLRAKEAYDKVPLKFAKVLIHKPSNTQLFQHGLTEYVSMCIEQVRQINTVIPVDGKLSSSGFVVAYHKYDCVKIISLAGLDGVRAKQAYDAVSLEFAKVLVHKPSNTVLFRHGMEEYVKKSIEQADSVVFPINGTSDQDKLCITLPLSSSSFFLAYHESTCVKIIALGGFDTVRAKEAYDAVPLAFAKVLIQKPSNTELFRHGMTKYVDMCIEEVRKINTVLPHGSWRQSSKEIESWFNSETGMVEMRCLCLTRDGQWKPNVIQFRPEDYFENQNGTLIYCP